MNICGCGCGGECRKGYVRGHKRKLSLEERFWNKVRKGDGCWEWAGSTSGPKRYGRLGLTPEEPPRSQYAHRLSYALHYGPIPDGVDVCHSCDNPRCVRPDHLFIGTRADNIHDMINKGRGAIGIRHGNCTLTDDQVREIRQQRACGIPARTIARQFGIHIMTVYMIIWRKRRRNVDS